MALITCANCGEDFHESGSHIYDEHTELTHCTWSCFSDWADGNFLDVLKFYRKMNVSKID